MRFRKVKTRESLKVAMMTMEEEDVEEEGVREAEDGAAAAQPDSNGAAYVLTGVPSDVSGVSVRGSLQGAHYKASLPSCFCQLSHPLSFHATFTYFPNPHFPPPPPHPALRLPPASALLSTHLSFCRRGPCLPLLPDQRFS